MLQARQSDSVAQLKAQEALQAKANAEAQLAALQEANKTRIASLLKNEVKKARDNGNYPEVLSILDQAADLGVEKQKVAENYAEIAFIYAHNPDSLTKAAEIVGKASKLLNLVQASSLELNDLASAKQAIKQLGTLQQLQAKYYGEMVTVEGGEFTMGNAEGADDETPHQVILDSYAIGKYELTVAQYRLFSLATGIAMLETPSWGWDETHAMMRVSWYDAVNYCNWLSVQQGLQPVYTLDGEVVKKDIEEYTNYEVTKDSTANGYRLPTEAEWEFAARGGKAHWDEQLTYAGSNEIDEVAWYYSSRVNSVGTKKPNQLGIYDMSGNVWEWCWDWYVSYPTDSLQRNPQGAESGSSRVLRGGSWSGNDYDCRVSYRDYYGPSNRNTSNGFRLSRDL